MAEHKKLIYADDLMAAFRSYMVEHHDRIKCVSAENCETCENGCLWRKVVSAAPTADAVEVVHGRWGAFEVFPGAASLNGYPCSVCGNRVPGILYNLNYCPNCGAKMDGGS